MHDLAGKIALITGGSRGIGRAVTLALAECGCHIHFCYHSNQAAAGEVCQTAAARDWHAASHQVDVTDRRAVDALVAEILAQHGRIDILVNNAGTFPQRAVVEMTDEEWDTALHINLFAVFYCCRAVLPPMVARQAGTIVNMASVAGQRGSAQHAHYAAAKGGVIAFTRSLAREVASQGIRVNAVAPGRITTELLLDGAGEAEHARWLRDTPIRRLGTPEEVAATVLFLVSDASGYIVGETIAVNGGLLMD